MENPKVSVIIPVYNVEKFLQRCIDSLLAQTYQNLEFIFVDDGSTDSSYSILREVTCLDNRICVYRQKNTGVSSARNTGITHSTGKYIMFCDSDDTVEPNWCETMVEAIEQAPNSWVACEINVLSESGVLLDTYSHSAGTEVLDKSEYYTSFIEGLSGSVYNKIYLGSIIRDRCIYFDETYKRGEDVEFNLRYFHFCESICVVSEKLYNYYRYDSVQTLTSTYHTDDFQIQTLMYQIRKPYISDRYLYQFQKHYWHVLCMETDKTMDATDHSLIKKLKLNKANICSQEYKELLDLFGWEELPAWQVCLLTSEKYAIYWMLQKLYAVKKKILTAMHWRRHE